MSKPIFEPCSRQQVLALEQYTIAALHFDKVQKIQIKSSSYKYFYE